MAVADFLAAVQAPANPEDQDPLVSFKANKQYAKSGEYKTTLPPDQEQQFQQWVKQNKVPWQDTTTADYDMRGYYQALQQGKVKQEFNQWDNKMHFPDTWKTPYDATFSNESMYALPNAPHWDGDKLVDSTGKVVVDETPPVSVSNKGKKKMSVGDFLGKVGEGLEKGVKAAGTVLEPVAKRTAEVLSGEAPELDAEKRQRQYQMEDAQINAKAQMLESQLAMGEKYGTLTPDQRKQYVDAITGLYSHPRHAGTLMEKLRKVIHPQGAVATKSPLVPTLADATPPGGTLATDRGDDLQRQEKQALESIEFFKKSMLPMFPPEQQATKLNEYIDHINGLVKGTEKPPKGLKAMEQGGVFFGIEDQDTGKQYLKSQLEPGGDAPPEAKQMYAAVQKAAADKQTAADKKEKEIEERETRREQHASQMLIMGLEKSIELGNIREAQTTLRDADKQYQTARTLADDMERNAPQARAGDQQAQLAILADHAGGTTKLAGGRLTRDVMHSITDSLPWLDKVSKQWATDPNTGIDYLSGITLSPDQIDKMLNVAHIRADVTKDTVEQIKSDHPELTGNTGIKPLVKPVGGAGAGIKTLTNPPGGVGGAVGGKIKITRDANGNIIGVE